MPIDEVSERPLGKPLPEVVVPAEVEPGGGVLEAGQFERDGVQSHNIRRVAAYGGLAVVLGLYGFGVYVIAVFLGLFPRSSPVAADMWHIVITVLAALFTVPTVLLLAVLRAFSASKREDEMPKSVHEVVGRALMKVVDRAGEIGK